MIVLSLLLFEFKMWLLGGLGPPPLLLYYMSLVLSLYLVAAVSCPDHSNNPSNMQDYITYYIFILFSFYKYWWIHDLSVLDIVSKIYS